MMPSSCRHVLLMSKLESSLAMWSSCLVVFLMLPLTVMSFPLAQVLKMMGIPQGHFSVQAGHSFLSECFFDPPQTEQVFSVASP